MQKSKQRLLSTFKKFYKPFKLNDTSWRGAIFSLLIITIILFIIQGHSMFSSHGTIDFIKATLVLIFIALGIGGLFSLLVLALKFIPLVYIWVLISSFLLLILCFINMPLFKGTIILVFFLVVVSSMFGASLYSLFNRRYINAKFIKKGVIIFGVIIGIMGLTLGVYWLNNEDSPTNALLNEKDSISSQRYQLSLENPSEIGNYTVKKLSYGSGLDLYRDEFGSSVDIVTQTVDGSAFVENWSSSRRKYLGFGPESMPINGLVWYPEGNGPFPLVIMVHGNHEMTDYSDTGYDYLGELLASRGFIFISIDENFLNLSNYNDMVILNGLKDENDARGWMMLEHVRALQKWNESKGNILYKKIDMDSIAVMGHSRGGEAAAIAAAFNKLKAYPDNGNIKFDYDFNIRSVMAIAPTDKMYKPSGKEVILKDINYLTLHGSHDMDVISFEGSNQYDRVKFTEKGDFFKASVYIYGANHGQFNRNWGSDDFGGLGNKLFSKKQLIPQVEQEKVAKVLITAFLESTLKNKKEYTKIFRDIRYASKWLPNTIYINNYLDTKTTLISTYEEDIDINTTTVVGGQLLGQNLTIWKEKIVPLKWGEKDTSAVYLGWNKNENPKDAIYTVSIPNERLVIKDSSILVFELAEGEEDKNYNVDLDVPIDLTIKVVDERGNEASLPLSYFSYIQPKLEGRIGKKDFFYIFPISEVVFQLFEFNLLEFKKINSDFEPTLLSKVFFVFDKTEKGVVVLDNIGIRQTEIDICLQENEMSQ